MSVVVGGGVEVGRVAGLVDPVLSVAFCGVTITQQSLESVIHTPWQLHRDATCTATVEHLRTQVMRLSCQFADLRGTATKPTPGAQPPSRPAGHSH